MSRLEGKVAVITGGNSGIGLAIAQTFAAEGAQVGIFGRNQETLTQAAQSIGEGTLAVQGDVSNLEDLDRLFSEVETHFGSVDILVVNAGIAKFAPVEAVDESFFDLLTNVNVKGALFTVQKALRLLNKGGSIILTTSAVNQMGMPNMTVYAATKAAVRSFARSLSSELLPRGIRVNALSPGPIETPIFERTGLPKEALDEFGQQIIASNPMKRFGKPTEMAKAALFLASDDSSYVAGSELVADGGMSQL